MSQEPDQALNIQDLVAALDDLAKAVAPEIVKAAATAQEVIRPWLDELGKPEVQEAISRAVENARRVSEYRLK